MESVDLSAWHFRVRCNWSLCRGSIIAYICRYPDRLVDHFFSFLHVTVIIFTLRVTSIFFQLLFSFSNFSHSTISHNADDTQAPAAAPSESVEDTSQVANIKVVSGVPVVDIEIDRGVPSWSVAEYKTHYTNILYARWFGVRISDGANAFMFDRQYVRHDTDIGTWTQRGTLVRRWCSDTLEDLSGFDVLIVCHAQEVSYLRRILNFMRNVDFVSVNRGIDIFCFDNPIDGFYLVMDADAW